MLREVLNQILKLKNYEFKNEIEMISFIEKYIFSISRFPFRTKDTNE